MNYYVFEGTEEELGTQRGECFKDTFCGMLDLLAANAPDAWVGWLEEKAIPYTEANFPRITAEIDAFAEACGTDRLSVFKVFYSQTKAWFTHHCSNIMVADSDRGPIFAKNMDPYPKEIPYICFYNVKPKNGLEMFGYGYHASRHARHAMALVWLPLVRIEP